MTQIATIQRVSKLKRAMIEASAELDRADASRIGLQEAIDASQAVLREAYGDTFDEDVQEYLDQSDLEDDFSDDDLADEETEK